MSALAVPARNRWESSSEHRDLAKKRSMEVIEKPWDTELSPVDDTREFVFLRDFFNSFHECIQSCQSLDLVRDLSTTSMESPDLPRHPAKVSTEAT
jgi:hypothetical protein